MPEPAWPDQFPVELILQATRDQACAFCRARAASSGGTPFEEANRIVAGHVLRELSSGATLLDLGPPPGDGAPPGPLAAHLELAWERFIRYQEAVLVALLRYTSDPAKRALDLDGVARAILWSAHQDGKPARDGLLDGAHVRATREVLAWTTVEGYWEPASMDAMAHRVWERAQEAASGVVLERAVLLMGTVEGFRDGVRLGAKMEADGFGGGAATPRRR